MGAPHFADRLILRTRELGHPLCVGLDPFLERIPAAFRSGSMAPADPATAEAVRGFALAVIERLVGRVAILKPQSACFERLGPAGVAVLGDVIAAARAAGLLVLLDAKRGDIGSTAEAYAGAYLGEDAPLRADALTVNAYLGLDTLEPFLARVERDGAGLFVLVRTSNPGAGDVQDLEVGDGTVHARLARALALRGEALRGPETGWSSLGAVVGATWPEQAEAIRRDLPHALFLVPGYGAQGGSARDAVRGFTRASAGGLEGGIVNSARAILFPEAGRDAERRDWERAFDDALGRAIDELSRAVS